MYVGYLGSPFDVLALMAQNKLPFAKNMLLPFFRMCFIKKAYKSPKKSLLVDMAVKGGPCPLRKVFVEGEKNLKILKFLFRKLVFVHDKKNFHFCL